MDNQLCTEANLWRFLSEAQVPPWSIISECKSAVTPGSFLNKLCSEIDESFDEEFRCLPVIQPTVRSLASPVPQKKEPKIKIQFLNLKQVYEKVQSRVNRQSRQRLVDARVRIVSTADAQMHKIQVYVERIPNAAFLAGDRTGRILLKPKMGNFVDNKQHLSVDLDSVYLSPNGKPVYKLSTVDADRRNLFRLVVVITFIDGSRSRPFVSRPILIRSRRPARQARSPSDG